MCEITREIAVLVACITTLLMAGEICAATLTKELAHEQRAQPAAERAVSDFEGDRPTRSLITSGSGGGGVFGSSGSGFSSFGSDFGGVQTLPSLSAVQNVPVYSQVQTVQQLPVVSAIPVQTVQQVPVVQQQPIVGGGGVGGIGFLGAGGGFKRHREVLHVKARGFGGIGGLGKFGGGLGGGFGGVLGGGLGGGGYKIHYRSSGFTGAGGFGAGGLLGGGALVG